MATGTVKWFNANKGYGFLTEDGGEDVYVNRRALPSGVTELTPGQRVEFSVYPLRSGKEAFSVRVLDTDLAHGTAAGPRSETLRQVPAGPPLTPPLPGPPHIEATPTTANASGRASSTPNWLAPPLRTGPPRLDVSFNRAFVLNVQAGRRRLEPIGSEAYDFDNKGSSSTSEETLEITNTTEFVMTFEKESATVKGGKGSVNVLNFASLEGDLESTLRRQYSIQATSTLSVQRTSRITIPPRTHVRVTFNWKRVWQDGTISVRTANGLEVALPYSITVDLSFDKTTQDIKPKKTT